TPSPREGAASPERPAFPPEVAQFYLPPANPVGAAAEGHQEGGSPVLVYHPRLLGFAEVVFADRKKDVEHRKVYRLLAEPPLPGQVVHWQSAATIGETLAPAPEPNARWMAVPESINTAKKLKAL